MERRCETDVTVVVGGVEFQHHSQLLCLGSEYFDAALHSGMKESATKRVELADKDPEEWKVVSTFFAAAYSNRPVGQISESNVFMLLRWFDFLGMPHMVQLCEKSLREFLFGSKNKTKLCSRIRFSKKKEKNLPPTRIGAFSVGSSVLKNLQFEFQFLCNCFRTCCMFLLSSLKEDLLVEIQRVLTESPDIPTQKSLATLVAATTDVNTDPQTTDSLQTMLQAYLPKTMFEAPFGTGEANHKPDENMEAVWKNPLLPHLLLKGMESRVWVERDRWLVDRINRKRSFGDDSDVILGDTRELLERSAVVAPTGSNES